jgi:hypothetical protein
LFNETDHRTRTLAFLLAALICGLIGPLWAQAAQAKTALTHPGPCHQPGQVVSAPSKIWDVIDRIDLACAWTQSVSGLKAAEDRATEAHLRWVAYDLEPWTVRGKIVCIRCRRSGISEERPTRTVSRCS